MFTFALKFFQRRNHNFQQNLRLFQTSFIYNERKIEKGVVITHTRDKLHRHKRIKDIPAGLTEPAAALIPYSPLNDPALEELIDRTFRIKSQPHQLLVIQPFKRLERYTETRKPDERLAEAVHLVQSIKGWKVVRTAKIGVRKLIKSFIFGRGVVERIANEIKANPKISAVFINYEILIGFQQYNLEQEFGVPVYDRYTIIMQIFKESATSREAMLQIQLAQLPYMWTRLRNADEGIVDTLGDDGDVLSTSPHKSVRKQVLKDLERKLKQELEKLKEHRLFLRENRKKLQWPTVAIVGYTNAGKTSLIKALTEDQKLTPKDKFFATLDVTLHQGYLPSGLDVLYMDTIGFISETPSCLLEAFSATLEDAVSADVIIHLRDISHPNTDAQNSDVIESLKKLNLAVSNLDNVITVANKIDMLNQDDLKNFQNEKNDIIFVSAVKNYGIDYLRFKLEELILRTTNRSVVVMKVKVGSKEYFWLHDEASVVEENLVSPDSKYINVKVIITEADMARFKHYFISNYRERR